jgi:hypothetical protein
MGNLTTFEKSTPMPRMLVKMSKNILVQVFRFITLNVKIMRLVLKGHG